MSAQRRQRAAVVSIGAAALAIVVVLAQPSAALKPFAERMRKSFALEKDKTGNCHLCHKYDKSKKEEPEGDNLDAFGQQLRKCAEYKPIAGKDEDHEFSDEDMAKFDAAIKAIWDKDADADGATNGEELALGSFPGDPASIPAKDALDKFRQEHPRK